MTGRAEAEGVPRMTQQPSSNYGLPRIQTD